MRASAVLALAPVTLLLAGCVSDMTYIRTDGQPIANAPVVQQQYQADTAVCDAEVEKARASAGPNTTTGMKGAVEAAKLTEFLQDVEKTCMTQKGYTLVYQNVAAVRQAELAAAAEEKRRREPAVAAAPPTPKARKKPATAGAEAARKP